MVYSSTTQHFKMFKQFYHFHLGVPCFPSVVRTSLSTSAIKSKKVSKENALKKYNKENKLLFGPLLETQAQRKKRIKIDDILVASDENTSHKKFPGRSNTSKYRLLRKEDVIINESEIKNMHPTMPTHQPIEISMQDPSTLSLYEILSKFYIFQKHLEIPRP